MIKVFLVEDEFVIREGIKKNIDWEGHGYQFVGEASDGEIAYPLIKKEKPDIVITDIRMPFMNGLELSKLIKKEMPLTEIIILSGFEEFEYAKEAIKLGVAQYLTKPISGDELLKELDLLSAKIEENKREREIREKYLSEMKEDTVNERKVFFEKLVRAAEPAAKLIQSAEDLNMNLSAVVYSIMLCKAFVHTHSQYEFSQRLVSIEEEIEEYIDEDYVIMFDRDLEGKAFLFKGDSKEQLDRIINEFCEKLKEIFKEYEGIGYFAGIGVYAERLPDITYSYETANKAFTKRYFTDESAIIRSDDISVADLSQEQFNVENLDVKNLDRSKIKEFLKFGDGNETEYFVDEYIQGLGVNAIKSQMFRQYIIMDIYFSVVEFVNTIISDDKEAILEGFKPDLVRTEEESRNYIVSIINKGIEIIEGGAGKLSVFRSKSPETATDTLAYCAICLHGRGTALKKGIYVLNYAEYIDEIKRSWQSKYESEDLQFMRIWSNSANYLIISGIDYVKFGDFECQTLLRLIQDRRNPSKSTYIVYGKENLIGTSDFFGRLLSIMKGAEVN